MFNQCRHIMPSGARCKSPILKGQSFCYFHWRLHTVTRGRPKESLPVPALEDPHGIQIALTQILGALGSSSLDNKRAGLYLYGLQIATQLTRRTSVPEPCDVVHSLSDDAATGESLAPEIVQCEPGTECDSCATCDQCVLPARVAYLRARQLKAQTLKEIQNLEIQKPNGFSQALAWANEPEWQDPSRMEEEETCEEISPLTLKSAS